MQPNAITVVIPTYNRERLVTDAIHSVCAQTISPETVIVVDDSSTDNTLNLLESLPGIKTISNPRNLGPSFSRNVAARSSTTEWIAFLDSDDIWLPHHLSSISAAISQASPSVGLIYTNTQYSLPRRFHSATLAGGNIIGTCSVAVVRRAAFDFAGGFDETIKFAEDWKLWLQISHKFEILHLPTQSVKYRRNTPGSLTLAAGIRRAGYVSIRQARGKRDRYMNEVDRRLWRTLLFDSLMETRKRKSAARIALSLLGLPGGLIPGMRLLAKFVIRFGEGAL